MDFNSFTVSVSILTVAGQRNPNVEYSSLGKNMHVITVVPSSKNNSTEATSTTIVKLIVGDFETRLAVLRGK
jgi:hypothetical protein